MIAITEIEAHLVLPTRPGMHGGGVQLGAPARASSMSSGGGLWSSVPTGSVERSLALRFVLAREHLQLMESHAQRLADESVPLELRLHVSAAWVRQSQDAPRPGPVGHPVPAATGLTSELWHLWETSIEPLRLQLRREDWADQILPGLGADSVRLIAVRLPATTKVLGPETIAAFDAARGAYDAGHYRAAVQACRDLRDAVQVHLGAVSGNRVAEQVAERLGWPDDSPAKKLLDNLWGTLVDVSSAAHHQPGRRLAAADARATILLAATVIEYLTHLLEPER